MNDLTKLGLEEIGSFVRSEEGQAEIMAIMGQLRGEIGNQEGYIQICREAEQESVAIDAKILSELLDHFNRFVVACPPGHDRNHIYRDMLAALALTASDSYVKGAQYTADVFAGILGACFHDIGNSVVHRYEDAERMAGHAEIGAWLFLGVSDGLISVPLRKLTAYAIAAHTHYTKPIAVKKPEGYLREPYWYELWSPEDKPVGFSVLLARFADRLDTNGVTLFARHLVATADSVEFGGGQDYDGEKFFEQNGDALNVLFLPAVREGKPKPPTTLEHIAMFADSNFGASIYSRDDHFFPKMLELIRVKVNQASQLTEIVTGKKIPDPQPEELSRALVKDFLRQVSGSPQFDRSWNVLRRAWAALTPVDQERWHKGFVYARKAYLAWLIQLRSEASRNKEFAPLAAELMDRCM